MYISVEKLCMHHAHNFQQKIRQSWFTFEHFVPAIVNLKCLCWINLKLFFSRLLRPSIRLHHFHAVNLFVYIRIYALFYVTWFFICAFRLLWGIYMDQILLSTLKTFMTLLFQFLVRWNCCISNRWKKLHQNCVNWNKWNTTFSGCKENNWAIQSTKERLFLHSAVK